MKQVSSPDNPLLKQMARLQRKPSAYRDEGLALLEGEHLIQEFLAVAGKAQRIRQLVISDAYDIRHEWLASLGHLIVQVPQRLLEPVASGAHQAHVFALVEFAELMGLSSDSPISLSDPSVILNGVQDAGNVGTIMRTAAAAGFTQLLLDAQCAAAWSPKVLRAAMGAHAHLRLHEQADLLGWLHATSLQTLCADVSATLELFDVAIKMPCAWVFGSEGQGLDAAISAACQQKIRIPQQRVESLNVASAAAICLYESYRQSR